ncbi:hypothetical protein TWF718_010545 [Orbilia javanica]|uniref:Uncharacterized protein n=1 Tax=Orbilia javanica TaxID=47235 RepID=A0AAN8MR63_9PEZI
MKFSAVIATAILAFVASAAPVDRHSRRATTADLANIGGGAVGSAILVARHDPLVAYLHKRQDTEGLKVLVTNYLVQNDAPPRITEFVQVADPELITHIMALPPTDMEQVVGALKAGRVPTIPGYSSKKLVLSFLDTQNIPAETMATIRELPEESFDKISNLPLSELDAVIVSLQAGKIPYIAGVTDGLPGVDPSTPIGTNPTNPQQPGQPGQPGQQPVTPPQVGQPVATAPIGTAPVATAPAGNLAPVANGRKVKREFGRPDASLKARQVQQMPGQLTGQLPAAGQVPTTGQLPQQGQMPPLPATGAELKALTIQDMTQGQAPPQLIQFVQTVPDSIFDSLRALELQVGGQNGQPFNQAIAAQLDQYWGQLFNGQMPTIAAAGTVPTTPVANVPAGVVPVAPVATAPVAALPQLPAGTVPVGTVPAGTVPGTTL